ncbi:MAG: type II 3-dehydroquinate dehydratase [Bacillota bacterium]
MRIEVVNGVNLNMLGKRKKSAYGTITLKELEQTIEQHFAGRGMEFTFFQSNMEGEIVEFIQKSTADLMLINAGAHTHYSYAIRDAVEDSAVKICEVHLSDITKREEFRKFSVLEDVCCDREYGKGVDGYIMLIERNAK